MNESDAKIQADAAARLPTVFGDFAIYLYKDTATGKEHLALVGGKSNTSEPVLVRIHSECMTGDMFGSTRCDCGHQLHHALREIAIHGGVLVYLRQEGRGIGLLEKLKAYGLQDQGYDTVEANTMLGHAADAREYQIAAKILRSLDVKQIRLITNNPDKVAALEGQGIKVTERVAAPVGLHKNNASYLKTKAEKLRHIFDFNRT